MRIGYAYWGFLGDEKLDALGKPLSTPDGNAFYSWSIINSLQEAGHKVYQMMPDRDRNAVKFYEKPIELFEGMNFGSSFGMNKRFSAYLNMVKDMYDFIENWSKVKKKDLFERWNYYKIDDLDVILLEWRMEVNGRNDKYTRDSKPDEWQPDLFIQECLLEYATKNHIKVIIFDLDYKLYDDVACKLVHDGLDLCIFELGNKWVKEQHKTKKKHFPKCMHVEVPFDFRYINNYDVKMGQYKNNLIYVGNRYERDWCIDKYIPTEMSNVIIYGNWLEGNRNSKTKWPNIRFGHRLQQYEMYDKYSRSICTILLAKREYVEHNFMTVRVIESVFYGTVPLFIDEYGEATIKRYAGTFTQELTVQSKSDVIDRCMFFRYNQAERKAVIDYLRWHLSFMSSENFVKNIEGVAMV